LNLFKKLIFFAFISISLSQVRIGDWSALTSPLNVRDLIYLNDDLYCATEGGLFIIKDDSYETLTTIEGLEGVNLASISLDKDDNVWIGGASPNGFVQIYDPIKKQSIHQFDFDLTSILNFQILDSLAFVLFQDGQDMGIMKFLYNDGWEYRDSFRNFPSDAGPAKCFVATDSILYVGMEFGIYKGTLSENLKDPNNWTSIDPNLNFEINDIVLDSNNLIFCTNDSLYQLSINTNVRTEIDFSYPLSSVDELFVQNGTYWFIDGKKLYRKKDEEDTLLENKYWLSGIAKKENNVAVGLNNGLLFNSENSDGTDEITRFLANAPVTNNFTSLTVLDDGRLVGGSVHGISIYDDKGWRNILRIVTVGTDTIHSEYDYSKFSADTVPHNFGGFIADLEQGQDGLLYCAIRGAYVITNNEPIRTSGGVIIIDVDDPSNITLIDTSYLSYHSTASNPSPYMVILDVEFNEEGDLWIANPYCINKNNPIHVRSLENEWKHYGSSETNTKISQSPGSIAIDSWNRVWVSSFQAEEANLGIYPNGGIAMLDYSGDPTNPDEFSWKQIQNSGSVWSLGMGMDNRIYFLTSTGLNYYDIKEGDNPVVRENTLSYFPNISFGAGAGIEIDPHGNVWTYSPTAGIHVLLENTTYWPDINGLQTSNSPLLSNEITDIAFDEKRNLAYIATSNGVNILRIPFGEEKKSYSQIKVYPSPFYLPSESSLVVDGLPFESSMMVMTLDGRVIRKILSQGISVDGDQLFWDGRDEMGDFVSSGVYLLAIYGMDGSQVVEKVTVIKK